MDIQSIIGITAVPSETAPLQGISSSGSTDSSLFSSLIDNLFASVSQNANQSEETSSQLIDSKQPDSDEPTVQSPVKVNFLKAEAVENIQGEELKTEQPEGSSDSIMSMQMIQSLLLITPAGKSETAAIDPQNAVKSDEKGIISAIAEAASAPEQPGIIKLNDHPEKPAANFPAYSTVNPSAEADNSKAAAYRTKELQPEIVQVAPAPADSFVQPQLKISEPRTTAVPEMVTKENPSSVNEMTTSLTPSFITADEKAETSVRSEMESGEEIRMNTGKVPAKDQKNDTPFQAVISRKFDSPIEKSGSDLLKTDASSPLNIQEPASAAEKTAAAPDSETPLNSGNSDKKQSFETTSLPQNQISAAKGGSLPVHPESSEQSGSIQKNISVPEQITSKIESSLKENGVTTVRLKLHPEDLGQVQITMTMDRHGLKMDIIAENSQAKALIADSLDTLRENLSRGGVSLDKVDVSTSGGNFSHQMFREENRPEKNSRSFAGFAGKVYESEPGSIQTSRLSSRHEQSSLIDMRL